MLYWRAPLQKKHCLYSCLHHITEPSTREGKAGLSQGKANRVIAVLRKGAGMLYWRAPLQKKHCLYSCLHHITEPSTREGKAGLSQGKANRVIAVLRFC